MLTWATAEMVVAWEHLQEAVLQVALVIAKAAAA
jgi:hypothetical protein